MCLRCPLAHAAREWSRDYRQRMCTAARELHARVSANVTKIIERRLILRQSAIRSMPLRVYSRGMKGSARKDPRTRHDRDANRHASRGLGPRALTIRPFRLYRRRT
ncbi:hypothetical protein BCAR13_560027 [Paraburkholderia caribensis]|nr:hypothetical protein BCAR13_560027 [Paraburkholderia caribensis]